MSEQWEGCEEVHWDCRIAQLEAELARREARIAELEQERQPETTARAGVRDCKGW